MSIVKSQKACCKATRERADENWQMYTVEVQRTIKLVKALDTIAKMGPAEATLHAANTANEALGRRCIGAGQPRAKCPVHGHSAIQKDKSNG